MVASYHWEPLPFYCIRWFFLQNPLLLVTFEPFIRWQWQLWNQQWLKWRRCKCAPDDSRKTEGKLILCQMKSSGKDSTNLFACVTRYIRRCQWILTRNEWWYTFTLANFRGDESSGRVGGEGQGLSSHQFCPGSPQSTMAGIQRFNQRVNKEVPPNPFPTCLSSQSSCNSCWIGRVQCFRRPFT